MFHAKRVAAVWGLCAGSAFAQTAGMLSFQGFIRDGVGVPLSGVHDFEFRIYDDPDPGQGTLVDMDGDGVIEDPGDDVTDVNVDVTNGMVITKFGPVHPKAFDGTGRWLEVSVDGVPLSRVEMATAPGTAEQVNIPPTGSQAITVSDKGNVGIGTTSPSFRLHVHENVANDIFVLDGDRPNSGVNGFVRWTLFNRDGDNSDKTWRQLVYGSSNQLPGGVAGDEFVNLSAYYIWFAESGEALRILNNGNVGIGTASPSVRLHVHENVANDIFVLDGDRPNSGVDGFVRWTLLNRDADNSDKAWQQLVYGSSNQLPGGVAGDEFANLSAYYIWFAESGEALRILNNGNVGIGIPSPGYKLDVEGSARARDGIKVPIYTASTTFGSTWPVPGPANQWHSIPGLNVVVSVNTPSTLDISYTGNVVVGSGVIMTSIWVDGAQATDASGAGLFSRTGPSTQASVANTYVVNVGAGAHTIEIKALFDLGGTVNPGFLRVVVYPQ